MYLDAVENHEPSEEAGRFGRIIEAGRRSGEPFPEIYHLFAFRPRAATHLAHLMQEFMRGPSPLSPGWRELIAAWTSARNHCLFWTSAHAAVAAFLLEDRALVDAVCADFESADIPERMKALFRYLAVVNDRPADVDQALVDRARAAGLTDEELHDGATVCAIFNFFNRWIDATGVPDVPGRFYEKRLEAHGDHGYAP